MLKMVKREIFFSLFVLSIQNNFVHLHRKRNNRDMDYNLIIKRLHSDPTYVRNLKKWEEVTDYLKNKVDQWTISIGVYKYSSDSRLLGHSHVTMGNLIEVASSKTDKILK